jgi:hypothetical protein
MIEFKRSSYTTEKRDYRHVPETTTIMVDGINYGNVTYFAMKYERSIVFIKNILDEFDIPVIKVSGQLFFEINYGEVAIEIMNDKNKYLAEIINIKLGEKQKEIADKISSPK